MESSDEQYAKNMIELKQKFAEEADEQITNLESAILILENNPEEKEQIESVFRVMHTLKGSGGMFGFNKISEFTHDLETIYDLIRKRKLKIDTELLDITLLSVDHLKELLRNGDDLDENLERMHATYTKKIKEFADDKLRDGVNSNDEVSSDLLFRPGQEEIMTTYYISFKFNKKIYNNGNNPFYQLDDLHSLGDAFVIPHTDDIPELSQFDPEICYTWWEIFVATSKPRQEVADVFIFVEGDSKIIIQEIADESLFEIQPFVDYLGELKTNNEETDLKTIKKIIDELPEKVPPPPVAKPMVEKQEAPGQNVNSDAGKIPAPAKKTKGGVISSIRVASEKIDALMNLASEMVTVQARLNMFAEAKKDPELISIAENVQKLSKQLRDNAFSISLIPIGSILTQFQRLVRDLSAQLGKKVNFVIEGQGTELDKTIIERITDPILHILRNSLDHGIETPEVRRKAGKPEEGTITFKAFHSGSNIHVVISDDGNGIDPQVVHRKAIQNKLVGEEEVLSKKQILNLIFAPGFSTVTKVSDVSGRGVGMDVVNKKISEIRGEVFIDSEPGKGTKITIALPLTLSIIDGMQVMISNTCFIIPTSAVHKIYSVNHSTIEKSFDNLVVLEGKQIPYFYLRQQFKLNGAPPKREEVLVVKYENREVGLIIDKVIGEFQTVLKPLGRHYKSQEFISGGTILEMVLWHWFWIPIK